VVNAKFQWFSIAFGELNDDKYGDLMLSKL